MTNNQFRILIHDLLAFLMLAVGFIVLQVFIGVLIGWEMALLSAGATLIIGSAYLYYR